MEEYFQRLLLHFWTLVAHRGNRGATVQARAARSYIYGGLSGATRRSGCVKITEKKRVFVYSR